MTDERPDPGGSADFPSTCWGQIAAAGLRGSAADHEALADLCRAYWYPIYVFIRRKGYGAHEAQDLTQSYFARLLEKDVLAAADSRRGRFRTFLLTDCTHFLSDQRDKVRAKKRGGGVAPVSIDARDAEGRYLAEPAGDGSPDDRFERAWVVTLLDRVLEHLGSEQEAAGRAALFARLRPALTAGPDPTPYAEVAAEFGMTEVAVQSAAQRLRRRFRDLVRLEIAATLDEPTSADIDDEIRSLFAALGR